MTLGATQGYITLLDFVNVSLELLLTCEQADCKRVKCLIDGSTDSPAAPVSFAESPC
jgi:hypothetical protein